MESLEEHPVLRKRMIVLIPEGTVKNFRLAQQIYQLALRTNSEVLYLAFSTDDDRWTVVREMATLTALTSNDNFPARSKIILSNDWINEIREYYRPGDRIVCQVEQMIKNNSHKMIPIQDLLSEEFHGPITTISGFYHPLRMLSKKWLYSLMFWLGCLTILVAFGALEMSINNGIQGFARNILLIIVMAIEIGILSIWNRVLKI